MSSMNGGLKTLIPKREALHAYSAFTCCSIASSPTPFNQTSSNCPKYGFVWLQMNLCLLQRLDLDQSTLTISFHVFPILSHGSIGRQIIPVPVLTPEAATASNMALINFDYLKETRAMAREVRAVVSRSDTKPSFQVESKHTI